MNRTARRGVRWLTACMGLCAAGLAIGWRVAERRPGPAGSGAAPPETALPGTALPEIATAGAALS